MTDIVQPKTTVEILTKARTFIEKGWTKYKFARDKLGRLTDTSSNDAVCWCAIGAIRAAASQCNATPTLARRALCKVLPSSCYYVAEYNDDPATTKEDVLDLFDRAIANEKAR